MAKVFKQDGKISGILIVDGDFVSRELVFTVVEGNTSSRVGLTADMVRELSVHLQEALEKYEEIFR